MMFIFTILIPLTLITIWVILGEIIYKYWLKDFYKRYAPYLNVDDYVKRHNAYMQSAMYISIVILIVLLLGILIY